MFGDYVLRRLMSQLVDWTTMSGNYSTSEQKTEFTWVNGDPIYVKTVDVGNLPNSSDKNVAHGISGLNQCIDARGRAYRSSDQVWFLIPNVPHPRVDLNTGIEITVNATNITISTGTDRSNMTGSVTLWYTKTTG